MPIIASLEVEFPKYLLNVCFRRRKKNILPEFHVSKSRVLGWAFMSQNIFIYIVYICLVKREENTTRFQLCKWVFLVCFKTFKAHSTLWKLEVQEVFVFIPGAAVIIMELSHGIFLVTRGTYCIWLIYSVPTNGKHVS